MASVRGIGVAVMMSWCGSLPPRAPLSRKRKALVHAEAMLLVDDHQAQLCELHRFLEQRVRAHHELDVAARDGFERAAPRARRQRAGDQRHGNSERSKPAFEILRVLLGQQLGGRHERGLKSGAHRARGGRSGDHGLAAADVTLHQPHHGPVVGEIAVDFGERARLRTGQRERQRFQKTPLEAAGIVEAPAPDRS